MNYYKKLIDSHFEFIKGIEGVSIKKFGIKSSDAKLIYITSYIYIDTQTQQITSTLNPPTSEVCHYVKSI